MAPDNNLPAKRHLRKREKLARLIHNELNGLISLYVEEFNVLVSLERLCYSVNIERDRLHFHLEFFSFPTMELETQAQSWARKTQAQDPKSLVTLVSIFLKPNEAPYSKDTKVCQI